MLVTTQQREDRTTAEGWVEAFAEGWRDPSDAESFCDHFDRWLDPDVRLVQPQTPTIVGLRSFREDFARPLFDLVPDLHGTVEGWASNGETIYIALRLEGTVGRREFELRSCDQVTLRDGKAIERVAHLDPTPLLRAVALSPSSWPRFLRVQLRARRRGARR
jgi:hypothetical protein